MSNHEWLGGVIGEGAERWRRPEWPIAAWPTYLSSIDLRVYVVTPAARQCLRGGDVVWAIAGGDGLVDLWVEPSAVAAAREAERDLNGALLRNGREALDGAS